MNRPASQRTETNSPRLNRPTPQPLPQRIYLLATHGLLRPHDQRAITRHGVSVVIVGLVRWVIGYGVEVLEEGDYAGVEG